MGLVKARRRPAEDMHRRGEALEGTLPKATRRARKRVRSPHQAARKQQRAVRKCCQCGSVASANVASFQLGIEIGHWQRGQRLHEMGAAEVGGAMGASPTAFVCY